MGEHLRIDAFELWCWKRLLRVPWTARRSNQSVLKEISPEYLLEGLTLKLKLQCFGHLMWRTDSLEKTLKLGKIEGRRRRGWQRMRWLHGITDLMDIVWASSTSWWWTGITGMLQSMGSQRVGHNREAELNWTRGGTSARLAPECPLDSCWNPSWGNPTGNQRARESGPLRSAYQGTEPSGDWIFRSSQENIWISSTTMLRTVGIN